jgi:hypothetical protein
MVERQQKMVDELINTFEKLNSSSFVGGGLLDITAIRNSIDESEKIVKEIKAFNSALIKETNETFRQALEPLLKDLDCLGISYKFQEGTFTNLTVLSPPNKSGEKESVFSVDCWIDSSLVKLPNGEPTYKLLSDKTRYRCLKRVCGDRYFQSCLSIPEFFETFKKEMTPRIISLVADYKKYNDGNR